MSSGVAWGPGFFRAALPRRRFFAGFDGFVDSLHRVIREHQADVRVPYRDIPEFGREITSRAGRSGGFELALQSVRAGGNGPHLAAGLSALGASAVCVGALGLPQIEPAFGPLAQAGCELLSVAPAALTTALEFDDGKLMLSDSRAFDGLGWDAVVAVLGLDRLRALLKDCDLVALVGWANMPLATDLWQGLLETALPPGSKAPKFFFDLADISRAGSRELGALVALLRRYRERGPVALGLNENEAFKLAAHLGLDPDSVTGSGALLGLTKGLRERLDLDVVVVHPRQGACVADAGAAALVEGRLVPSPALSTGGGDHFNAGFCFGWTQGLTPLEAAELGARASACYVEQGRSPRLEELAVPSARSVLL